MNRPVDRQALRAYAAMHQRCEVLSCVDIPCPEPHHLRPRGLWDATEAPRGLLMLCQRHHMAWHTVGRRTWLVRYGRDLAAATYAKVARIVEG